MNEHTESVEFQAKRVDDLKERRSHERIAVLEQQLQYQVGRSRKYSLLF